VFLNLQIDNAGSVSQSTDTIGLDTINPTGSIVINGGDAWTNTTSVSLTLVYDDATSGVVDVRYSNDGSSWSDWETPSSSKEWTLGTSNGIKTVYYEIRDAAGIISQFTDIIGLDTVDPTGSIDINSGDAWTNSSDVFLTLTYDDATSGVVDVRYSNDGISWTPWEDPSGTRSWTLSIGDADVKPVYYQTRDLSGRISQFSDTIGLDTAVPTGSIIINGGDLWTTSIVVTLSLTYTDATSGVDQVRYSNDGTLWTAWEDPGVSRSWTLSSGDGTKTVYFQIKDEAGLFFQTTDTIDFDTTDPTGSIEINNGDMWTNTTSVFLTLVFNDITSGVHQVRYRNDGDIWTTWEDPSDTLFWTLSPGDGTKTVYYEIRDNAGLTFQTTDSIVLDTEIPTGSIEINGGNTWASSNDVTLSLTYDDYTSGVFQVRYSNDGSSWTAWEDPSVSRSWTLSSGDGSKIVYYEIKDNAELICNFWCPRSTL
jgi:hypothetical protein